MSTFARKTEATTKLGLRIKEMRVSRGLTQRQLAILMGAQQPAIARLESGRVKPDLTTLERISAALDYQLVVTAVPRDVVFDAGVPVRFV